MIIIRMSGGMGNQMFEYALYTKLVYDGKSVCFDDVTEYLLDNRRPIVLDVFGIDYPKCSREELVQMTDADMSIFSRIRRKLFGRKSLEHHEPDINFDPQMLSLDPAYLTGCFQSEQYFKDVEDEIRRIYDFEALWKDSARMTNLLRPISDEKSLRFRRLYTELGQKESVAIHIRRGDYLNAGEVYGGICTEAYYDSAVRYVIEKADNPTFYLFTNDTSWGMNWCRDCESRFKARFICVDVADEGTGYLDMMLMSRCRHAIIANSSFSWWGSYLIKNPQKLVIAPSKWLNNMECRDIYRSDMIRMDSKGMYE